MCAVRITVPDWLWSILYISSKTLISFVLFCVERNNETQWGLVFFPWIILQSIVKSNEINWHPFCSAVSRISREGLRNYYNTEAKVQISEKVSSLLETVGGSWSNNCGNVYIKNIRPKRVNGKNIRITDICILNRKLFGKAFWGLTKSLTPFSALT